MNKQIVEILMTLYERIYHNSAPVDCNYPLVVYNLITLSPSLRADNRTHGARAVYRITVIDKLETPDSEIRQAFEDAGWLWEGTNVTQDKGKNEVDEIYTSIDVSKLTEV